MCSSSAVSLVSLFTGKPMTSNSEKLDEMSRDKIECALLEINEYARLGLGQDNESKWEAALNDIVGILNKLGLY